MLSVDFVSEILKNFDECLKVFTDQFIVNQLGSGRIDSVKTKEFIDGILNVKASHFIESLMKLKTSGDMELVKSQSRTLAFK